MRKLFCILLFFPILAHASDKILNLYAWTGEIPDAIVTQFEKETGIKVNFSTYESNEVMYAKLRSMPDSGYDIIIPSSYFVERMKKQGLLLPLNKKKLPNIANLNPSFAHPTYDNNLDYSIPLLWGVTGIFVNKNAYSPQTITKWSDLWNPAYVNQLMLLDDTREVFAMALIALGYSGNDHNPEHIKQAFLKLKTLMNNVKVFSTETVVSIMIDEDANLGMAWNGDAYKAWEENKNVTFIYPKDGFMIWVDNFAITKTAHHKDAAYQFLNFMLRPDIAKQVAIATSYPVANLAGEKLLPETLRNNPTSYPSADILKHGEFEIDVDDATLALYEKYWEELKMGS